MSVCSHQPEALATVAFISPVSHFCTDNRFDFAAAVSSAHKLSVKLELALQNIEREARHIAHASTRGMARCWINDNYEHDPCGIVLTVKGGRGSKSISLAYSLDPAEDIRRLAAYLTYNSRTLTFVGAERSKHSGN